MTKDEYLKQVKKCRKLERILNRKLKTYPYVFTSGMTTDGKIRLIMLDPANGFKAREEATGVRGPQDGFNIACGWLGAFSTTLPVEDREFDDDDDDTEIGMEFGTQEDDIPVSDGSHLEVLDPPIEYLSLRNAALSMIVTGIKIKVDGEKVVEDGTKFSYGKACVESPKGTILDRGWQAQEPEDDDDE